MAYTFSSPEPQWGPIIDLENDWKPYDQYVAGKTDQDPTIQMIIKGTSDWIQNYCGKAFAPTTFEEEFDGWSGWGGAYVMLPYYPVLEIVRVAEYWGMSGPHELVMQTPDNQYGVGYTTDTSPGTYQINPRTGKLIRTFPGLIQKPFFPGSRNIVVEWIAGYDPIPGDIKLAALEMANHWYRATQEEEQYVDVMGGSSESSSDRNTLWPAVPGRVTTLLQPYRQQGIG